MSIQSIGFIMGMGMALSMSSTLSTSARQANSLANYQQRQHDMAALKGAIQSGDLASAQAAYSTLTQSTPNLNPNSPLAQLGQSLQNGNLAQAQQELASWGVRSQDAQTGNSNSAHASSNPASSMLAGVLSQSIGAANFKTSSHNSPSSPAQASKAIDSFLQNLMILASQQTSSSASVPGSTNTTPSASTVMAQATASSKQTYGKRAGSHHHSGGHGMGQSSRSSSNSSGSTALSDILNTLANEVSAPISSGSTSSSNSPSESQSPAPSPISFADLQGSFQSMVSSLGGNPQTASLSSFLSTLGQNLQNGSTTGNFINITA